MDTKDKKQKNASTDRLKRHKYDSSRYQRRIYIFYIVLLGVIIFLFSVPWELVRSGQTSLLLKLVVSTVFVCIGIACAVFINKKSVQPTLSVEDINLMLKGFGVRGQLTDLEIQNLSRLILGKYRIWFALVVFFRTTIFMGTIIGGIFGTYLLMEQNNIAEVQTNILNSQSDILATQNKQSLDQIILSESQRYERLGTQALEISLEASQLRNYSTLDGYDQKTARLVDNFKYKLETIAEIAEPYWFIDLDAKTINAESIAEVKSKFLSRERGMILKSIAKNSLDIQIYQNSNFEYADFRNYTGTFLGSQLNGRIRKWATYTDDYIDGCEGVEEIDFEAIAFGPGPDTYFSLFLAKKVSGIDFTNSNFDRLYLEAMPQQVYKNTAFLDSNVILKLSRFPPNYFSKDSRPFDGLSLVNSGLKIYEGNDSEDYLINLDGLTVYRKLTSHAQPSCVKIYTSNSNETAENTSVAHIPKIEVGGLTIVIKPNFTWLDENGRKQRMLGDLQRSATGVCLDKWGYFILSMILSVDEPQFDDGGFSNASRYYLSPQQSRVRKAYELSELLVNPISSYCPRLLEKFNGNGFVINFELE